MYDQGKYCCMFNTRSGAKKCIGGTAVTSVLLCVGGVINSALNTNETANLTITIVLASLSVITGAVSIGAGINMCLQSC